jgi:hypothetical protein
MQSNVYFQRLNRYHNVGIVVFVNRRQISIIIVIVLIVVSIHIRRRKFPFFSRAFHSLLQRGAFSSSFSPFTLHRYKHTDWLAIDTKSLLLPLYVVVVVWSVFFFFFLLYKYMRRRARAIIGRRVQILFSAFSILKVDSWCGWGSCQRQVHYCELFFGINNLRLLFWIFRQNFFCSGVPSKLFSTTIRQAGRAQEKKKFQQKFKSLEGRQHDIVNYTPFWMLVVSCISYLCCTRVVPGGIRVVIDSENTLITLFDLLLSS